MSVSEFNQNEYDIIEFRNDIHFASFFEPGKIQRIDQPAVPQLAIREALTNAFCHRDYSNRSASPFLAIYDDRLEIWNPGGLLPELKVEQLKGHEEYAKSHQ